MEFIKDIIIVYPSKDTALKLRDLLVGEGFSVTHICALGSSALSIANSMNDGVIVCASMLSDMNALSIAEDLPPDFDVVALCRNGKESYTGNLINLALPIDRADFIQTIYVLATSRSSFTRRKENERELIDNAKHILFETRNMTEVQAHKYLQQQSMNSGRKIVDIAKDIITAFAQK